MKEPSVENRQADRCAAGMRGFVRKAFAAGKITPVPLVVVMVLCVFAVSARCAGSRPAGVGKRMPDDAPVQGRCRASSTGWPVFHSGDLKLRW